MFRILLFRAVLLVGVLLATTLGVVALDIRVANTTLAVPSQPPVFGYQTVNALGNLTFTRPVAIVAQPGETNRLFIVEQSGLIYVITNLAAPTKTLFLDISGPVDSTDNEQGLLGMAFHPNWLGNRYFYLFYTIETTVNGVLGHYDRLARYEIDPANPNAGLPASEFPFISQADRAENHNGGDLHFGPEGYLYVSTGDEGGGGDGYDNSRSINKGFFSAILRIDVDRQPGSLEPSPHPAIHTGALGKAHYSIPAGNPFIGATGHNGSPIDPNTVRTEIWATGLRNPWRFSFDTATDILYCADVGQGLWEEVDIIVKGGDYGWRLREGAHPYGNNSVPAGVTLIDPIAEYPHSNGPSIPGGTAEGVSITGGVVYNGDRFPQLKGYYVFGDAYYNRIFALRYEPGTGQAQNFQQLASVNSPVAFGVDPANGDVLIAGLGGTVSRLIYSDNPTQGQPLPTLLSQTGAFGDLAMLTPEAGIVPYDLNLPFWSDYAIKSRWFSIPAVNKVMTFSAPGNWLFPTGTVWIKHFDMEMTNGVPASRRRLETRFLVKNDGGIHGFTYKWNTGQTDAELVAEAGVSEVLDIRTPGGSLLRSQTWRYPSRGECLQCHTAAGGYALGFNTVQLNRVHDYGNGPSNQIEVLSKVGYFNSPVTDVPSLPVLSRPEETTVSLERRVRSYLQANCVQCHQPGGPSQGSWDARIATTTAAAGLINGSLINDLGDPLNRVLAPADVARSVLLQKLSTRGPGQMPPLASSIADPAGTALLTEWINAGLPTGNLVVPVITWSNPAAIGYGTALGPAQLNASASVPGSFGYNPLAGTVLNAGNSRTLTVSFTPADTATYSSAQASVQIDVSPALLTVTAENMSKVYGAANPALTASYAGFVNGDISASLDTPVTLATSATLGSPVGSYSVVASGATDPNYTISHVNGSLSVTPAALAITAENKSKVYGAANPALTAAYTGFVNGDTAANLDLPVIFSTSATSASPVENYAITVSGAVDVNYTITHVNGSLAVTRAPLTITAQDKSRAYGAANPALTASYTGFVNGDTSASLDSPVVLTTSATSGSPVGSYSIGASGAADANYTVSHANGSLSVTPAPLTITAENKTKVEGQPNPSLTASYNSFVNGEGPPALDNSVILSTTAMAASTPGQYPITASGASGANYQISFVAGTLTVEANARFAPLELGRGNRVTLHVTGHPERTYRIQWSPDLDQWTEFASVATDGSGLGTYVEASDPLPGNRFFRILWP